MNAAEKLIVKKAVRAKEKSDRVFDRSEDEKIILEATSRFNALYDLVLDLELVDEYHLLLNDKIATGD